MAITGSGTEQDPYIVHSYDEIKDIFTNASYTGYIAYINLANDIDCNSYGSTFEWETVSVPSNDRSVVFDLCGHAIKTFKIRSGNAMFKFGGLSKSIVKNGKILNVYAGGSQGLVIYEGGIYNVSELNNVSVSMTIQTGLASDAVAIYAAFDRCSIYIEGSESNDNNSLFYTRASDMSGKFVDSDILLNVILGHARVDQGNENIERCRYRGSCSGGAKYNTIFGGRLMNCVLDIYLDISTSYRVTFYEDSTGIINENKIPSDCRVCGMTKVTSQEIINGDALRAKGFEVVNVVGV